MPLNDILSYWQAAAAEADPIPMARELIKRVEVTTAYGPSIELDDPFAPGPPNPYLEKLQPQVKLFTPAGKPIVIAPYGTPPTTRWPMVKAAAVGGVIVGGLGLLWLTFRK